MSLLGEVSILGSATAIMLNLMLKDAVTYCRYIVLNWSTMPFVKIAMLTP